MPSLERWKVTGKRKEFEDSEVLLVIGEELIEGALRRYMEKLPVSRMAEDSLPACTRMLLWFTWR
jgi:hypothetical protein